MSEQLYLVSVNYEDARRTADKFTTDERVEPGDVVYAKQGRAIVRSCCAVTPAAPRVYLQGGGYRIA